MYILHANTKNTTTTHTQTAQTDTGARAHTPTHTRHANTYRLTPAFQRSTDLLMRFHELVPDL